MNKIGFWKQDTEGLPCFEYTGKLPYKEKLKNGVEIKLPDDPWFLLGNYQLTVFTHVSGEYELISGQRSWARINQGKERNSGINSSVITVNGKEYSLTGMKSLATDPSKCKRIFGCGFADYFYEVDGISVEKNMSVKPSSNPYSGTSAFLLTVTVKNNKTVPVEFIYTESLGVNFETIQYQTATKERYPVKFDNEFSKFSSENTAVIKINARAEDPLLVPDRSTMSRYEGFPPEVFIKTITEAAEFYGDSDGISAKYFFSLAPGEEKVMRFIIGYSFENEVSERKSICQELENAVLNRKLCSAFAKDWKKSIPFYEEEPDNILRRELQWHAYTLEAMATYSEYYKETKIPQGTCYDYSWGIHASARDNFQHALPLVYYNKALAKSVIRYMLKRTTPFGEIRLIEVGNGYVDNERYNTSDQQLYYFMLLSEYLRVTGDYEILSEKVAPFPVKNQTEMTVLEFTEKCFMYLRDTVGTGFHGLVRLLNSDWGDGVYFIEKSYYNNCMLTGESHMNSAMAISVLHNLILQLNAADKKSDKNYTQTIRLAESMLLYREKILSAFMKDMEGHSFPKRMYFDGKAHGEDKMFLEPQGFTLQIDELSIEKKKTLYAEMKKRVYNGEKIGAREAEEPRPAPDYLITDFEEGSRENGGFWWALNGPIIMGVSKFDKDEAIRLLKKMSLNHLSEEFPEFWTSYWSAADTLESSLIPEEGLPDQSLTYASIPIYCAHPHAWILYCWYLLAEKTIVKQSER